MDMDEELEELITTAFEAGISRETVIDALSRALAEVKEAKGKETDADG